MPRFARKPATSKASASSSGPRGGCSLSSLLLCCITGAVCFYSGMWIGSSTCSNSSPFVKQLQQQQRREESQQKMDPGSTSNGDPNPVVSFKDTMKSVLVGLNYVDRNKFAKVFDTGVPLDASRPDNREVLILYQAESAMPSSSDNNNNNNQVLSVEEATANCDFVNVILTDHSRGRRQCMAIMGQYEAFHIQKFMRLPEKGRLDETAPLRLVNRGAQASGRKSTKPPDPADTLKYWEILRRYLSTFEEVVEKQLAPIAKRVATSNTIIVMVCNFGQSELLLNFVCSARRRGLDLSHILLFATDTETRDLAQSIGLTTFYDSSNYAELPSQAAGRYGDTIFMQMMMAKVFCVQMISWLGYNVLFQDVDVIWYKDPLTYFFDELRSGNFDVYFQDDGNHSLYYAPYSANTGFYYVRANERTRHFFNSFLLAGDLVFSTRSHQIPLVALLQEHASMYGLKVKIFSRDEDDFPGGHAFHRRKDFMKNLIDGKVVPFIFHMSWTTNKKNKVKFYRQLGEWYLQDQCVQKPVKEILGHEPSPEENDEVLVEPCCASEAIFSCHYSDKPSKRPCKDSPTIDNGGRPWW